MNDRQILQLLLSRAEQAIEALAAAYGSRLYGIAHNILGSNRDAEECVNDTYLALWNAIPPEEPDPLCAYAYRTGRNIALKRLRSNTAAIRRADYDLSLEELAGCIPAGDLWEQMEARELGRILNAFLESLSKENRIIFLRRYWFGDSVKSIAKSLGLKEGTVSARLSRTRTALKHYLITEGYDLHER